MRTAQRRVEVGHPIVEAHLIMHVVPAVRELGRCCQVLGVSCQLQILGQDRTAAARRDRFVPVEAQCPQTPEGPGMLTMVIATERFCSIFHKLQPIILGNLEKPFQVTRMSESVHRNQGPETTSGLTIPENSLSRFCDLLQPFFQSFRIHPQCLLVTIHKMRNRPTIMHRICRGHKTQRGNQDLIIALHPS